MLGPRTREIARVCGALGIWGGLLAFAAVVGASVAFFIIEAIGRIGALL